MAGPKSVRKDRSPKRGAIEVGSKDPKVLCKEHIRPETSNPGAY